jgi:hypothetical protein
MLIVTNKVQRNTIFFIVVKALHVSGDFPAHHQELKNCKCSIWYLLSLIAATASVVEMFHLNLVEMFHLNHASSSLKHVEPSQQ